MRLDRHLGQAVPLTRSQAQRAIRGGHVTVDGSVVRDPAFHLGADNRVEFRGRIAAPRGPRYLMLHKPAGVVCATRDARHRTVLDLLPSRERKGLHIAGRLDLDTTGLVLLSDDGDWSHRITAPRHHCPKRYRVELAEPLDDAAAAALQSGVQLDGEKGPTRPAQVERLAPRALRLSIGEGKYHQVKRMLAAVGNHVTALHREAIGGITLDPALAPGEWRELTEAEIASPGGKK